MEPTIILDASGILRSSMDYSRGGYAITGSVLQELASELAKTIIEENIRKGNIKIMSCTEKGLSAARQAASQTGDISALSGQDLEVLACAKEHGLTILSDDYAIQNTAAKMGLKTVSSTQKGISREITWVWSCQGCGKGMAGPGICEICGHKGRRRPGKII